MTSVDLGDLADVTCIIPLRVDSAERARNATVVIAYLRLLVGVKVVVTELDTVPRFPRLSSQLAQAMRLPHVEFDYRFEQERRTDGVFRRTRLLNTMILQANTPIVVNYDADVILPLLSYHVAAAAMRTHAADVVYPYSFGGNSQRRVYLTEDALGEFVEKGYALTILDAVSTIDRAEFGFCQFFRREAYVSGYLENENFISYGPEDVERHHRFSSLGYRVTRVEGPVYHLEHPRTFNSTPANPFMRENVRLWQELKALAPRELRQYYEDQLYVRLWRGAPLSARPRTFSPTRRVDSGH